MSERATVLLHHEWGERSHYDWMLEDPAAPAGAGLLLTWRVAEPASRWVELGRVRLEELAGHRREYLAYEGEVSGGRGRVRRVDEGRVSVLEWDEGGGEMEVRMRSFSGRIRVRRTEDREWRLEVR